MSKKMTTAKSLPGNAALACINIYRRVISPLTPPSCRFIPTCSEYAHTAISLYGVRKGGWMAIKRITRCHPWNPGGLDPVK